MKIKNRNILISLAISGAIAIFIFLIRNNANTELGGSFNSFVKLQFARYFGLVSGIIALIVASVYRANKKNGYTNRFLYIFSGVLNFLLGIGAVAFYVLVSKNNMVLNDFLLNLLFGTIIILDVLLSRTG